MLMVICVPGITIEFKVIWKFDKEVQNTLLFNFSYLDQWSFIIGNATRKKIDLFHFFLSFRLSKSDEKHLYAKLFL